MTAATKDRNTIEQGKRTRSFGVSAGAKGWAGTLAGLTAAGTVQAATLLATTPKCAGVFLKPFDNTGGAASAFNVDVTRDGVWGPFANSAAGDQITLADVDSLCYVVDDSTVAKTSATNTRASAGYVHQVDADGGVWIRFA